MEQDLWKGLSLWVEFNKLATYSSATLIALNFIRASIVFLANSTHFISVAILVKKAFSPWVYNTGYMHIKIMVLSKPFMYSPYTHNLLLYHGPWISLTGTCYNGLWISLRANKRACVLSPPTVTGWAVGNRSLSLQSGAHAGLPRLAICVHSTVSNRWTSSWLVTVKHATLASWLPADIRVV